MSATVAVKNFLPQQYEQSNRLPINHNYLAQQFADYEEIFAKLKQVVIKGDFTLGEPVDHFENQFKAIVKTQHAIAVGSGTDALFLALKALGIQAGDEVITTPFTFYATIGAIVTAGARPVFADILDDYNLDPECIAAQITAKTKAILPVHWAGKPCHMQALLAVAGRYGIPVVEDACHAIQAAYRDKPAGAWGKLGCFSFHPLKNLNVWGDGGMIVTDCGDIADRLRLMRNHGLKDRDECLFFAYNSRLDTLQAVVASHVLQKLDYITQQRIAHAAYLDQQLALVQGVRIPQREAYVKQVYHLYCIQCDARDALQAFLVQKGIDAKVHYPVPMHLQPAARAYGYRAGDFPVCEAMAQRTLSLPVHEFITLPELDYMVAMIREFYDQS